MAKKEKIKETFDIHFNDDESSMNKGFDLTKSECMAYIKRNNGTNNSYFADYKGGTVSIVSNLTGKTVFVTIVK